MPKKALVIGHPERTASLKVAEAILGLIAQVPNTDEPKSPDPGTRARVIASRAAMKAALTAGSLALPPGTLGWLTMLPELVAVWKLQAQMVADIAGIYDKNAYLTREQMIYCLFRHTAAQAVRDLVVRVGERILVQGVSLGAMQVIAREVGISITRRAIRKGVSRWLPVIGALGVGTYAYFDTAQVARTAIELFEREITLDCSSPQQF
ncbi:MAG: EcsC family protein [Pseudomonadota bacterium]|nr:EcsC family protein [Pseudomonadota bacterium]